jgi:acyl dehydratase
MGDFFLEDLRPGQVFRTGGLEVTAEDIVAFGRQFDPQHFHVDPAAAAASAFGGLVASGLHTLCLSFRLFFDLRLWERAIIGSPGMRDLNWSSPLRPGDRIRAVVEVVEVRRSASRPDRGIVTMRHDTFNQRDERILSVTCLHMLRARQPGAAPDSGDGGDHR